MRENPFKIPPKYFYFIKGDIDWLSLNANGDFTEESFTMGFMIENMDMGDKISDGESW